MDNTWLNRIKISYLLIKSALMLKKIWRIQLDIVLFVVVLREKFRLIAILFILMIKFNRTRPKNDIKKVAAAAFNPEIKTSSTRRVTEFDCIQYYCSLYQNQSTPNYFDTFICHILIAYTIQ